MDSMKRSIRNAKRRLRADTKVWKDHESFRETNHWCQQVERLWGELMAEIGLTPDAKVLKPTEEEINLLKSWAKRS